MALPAPVPERSSILPPLFQFVPRYFSRSLLCVNVQEYTRSCSVFLFLDSLRAFFLTLSSLLSSFPLFSAPLFSSPLLLSPPFSYSPPPSSSFSLSILFLIVQDPLEFVSALLTLHALLSEVQHLKINGRHWPSPSLESLDDTSSTYAPPLQDPLVDLTIFSGVTILEIDCVPPERVTNLPKLSAELRLLKFSRCGIFDLSAIFGGSSSSSSPIYPKLTHFKAASCSIDELSGLSPSPSSSLPPPISLLTGLQSLNLSGNNLLKYETALAGLASLVQLVRVDLSFNAISSMDNAFTLLGNVKMLILTGNRLSSAKGIDRLYSLEYLALDNNCIEAIQDVAGVARLPCLADIQLQVSAPLVVYLFFSIAFVSSCFSSRVVFG